MINHHKPGNITLAIESAICGGSISLIKDNIEIAHWIGSSGVSKAEDLLANIDQILTENGIFRYDIGLIAVSAGPGSFTGIRIGIATALGLKAGLGVPMSSESALKAMIFDRHHSEKLIAALPVGRNAVCLQTFSGENRELAAHGEPFTITEDEFIDMASRADATPILAHANLCEKAGPSAGLINFGSNIAYSIGVICSTNPGVVTDPLFISKSF